jgi:YidC/Oxa1 family membrane protein insertase
MNTPFSSFVREWQELVRFRALPSASRSIVFYAQDAGYWTYLEGMVRELTSNLNQQICYVTSAPDDPVMQCPEDRLLPFYIGLGMARTIFFKTLRADVMIMTMPDLQTFHIKRSSHPVHYAYVHHSLVSTHMSYRPGAFDHFDAVLCVGPHHNTEIRAREDLYGLNPKILVNHGYGRLDSLDSSARDGAAVPRSGNQKRVLIAPSWGKHALLETCGAQLMQILITAGYGVIVRPHSMTTTNNFGLIKELLRRFGSNPNVEFDLGPASQKSLHASDIMISDWGGAGLEYAFGLQRPVIFVDLPRKVINPDYETLACEPLEVALRSDIGAVVSPYALDGIASVIDETLRWDPGEFKERVRRLRSQWVYNLGSSGAVGAEYILEAAKDAHRARGT